jgi:hypothetical protein
MTLPAVNITELDGALGILPATAGRLLAFVGPATSGPLNTPAAFARTTDLVANYGQGPTVEAAAHYIDAEGKPVVFVRTGNTTAGSADALVSVATGTSVVTLAASPTPNDDYDLVALIAAGGTVGSAGITYQLSYDNGRTYGPVTQLGTANTITFGEAGGVVLDLAAGTLVAGDKFSVRTHAPCWNTTELGAALDALKNSTIAWEQAVIVGPVDGSAFDVIDPKFTGMATAGKYRSWIGAVRMPNAAESEATYLAAMVSAVGSKASTHGALCAGAAKIASGVNGRIYRRSTLVAVASRSGAVAEHINIAAPNLGSLAGVSIRDDNGNVDEHDEAINPGLDDARFITLRTHEGLDGVYITRPRLFSPSGSDFQIIPDRRVMNLALIALRAYFLRRLNAPVQVDKTTGYILPHEASEIELGARAAMRAVLMAAPKASDVNFVLSRTDDIISTKTLTGTATITPLADPETINVNVGFINPALQLRAAA